MFARWSGARRLLGLLVALLAVQATGRFTPRSCLGAAGPGKQRTPWTTSRVTGSPEPPPPFKAVPAFPNLRFERPLLLARCPGSDRLFVGEQAGVLYSFRNRSDAQAELFCDLRKELTTLSAGAESVTVESFYGLAFHPQFAQNRQCFVCYTVRGQAAQGPNFPDGTRVSRFTVTKADPPRIDPASEEIVLTFLQGGHNGGNLHFGPDGLLYISTGDAASPNPPDPLSTGQDITDLLSSILRIDVDRPDAGRKYGVPRDNPFVGLAGARPEVWAYGFRNPWRMSFDRLSGELFVGDVGWELWEMVHRIERGGNYGWAATEGPQPIKPESVGPTPIHPPLIELSHTVACSITGGYVYRGRKFPELYGAYVFGDWETRRLWAARFAGNQVTEMPELTRPTVRIVAFGEDNEGELYFLDHDSGTLQTLERNEAAAATADFPQTLSQTGLFASVAEHTPAAGVVPFAVNSPQWLDGATAERWLALPGESFATLYETGKPVPGLVYWHNFRVHFPRDAVLVRTISLAGRRLETQLLHFAGEDWRAYTYLWRDDQTDADLAPADGAEKEVRIGERSRLWQFQSRTQCLLCHSNQSEYALSFLPEQLNRTGPDGRNQLVALTELGVLRRADNDSRPLPPFDDAAAGRQAKVPDPADASLPLEARARGYLHANCGHCHSDHGGGAVALRLHFQTPLDRLNAVGVPPTRGDLGLPDARIIKPGDPHASTLYFRMAKFGKDRMPHIGSELPDETGLQLVERWIAALPTEGLPPGAALAADPLAGPPEDGLQAPSAALRLARQLGRGELDASRRSALLTAAAKLPAGAVRDLFEGYLPVGNAEQRRLGTNPRPATILARGGEPRRGEAWFWSEAVNCGKCHRIGERGAAVGPDLSAIGQTRTREELLDSLLGPSRRIEPKYAMYVAQTTDGRSLAGLLIQRDDQAVVLRDAQGKDIRLEAAAVEKLQPSRVSLMPEGQLAGLTAQDAADLLEYLVTRQTAAPAAEQ